MSCGQPCWTCGGPIPPGRHRLNEMERAFCSDACRDGFGPQGELGAGETCTAAQPVRRLASATGRMLGDSPVFDHAEYEQGWRECGQPAAGAFEYTCACGLHPPKRRTPCAGHWPEPGAVGCRECFDAGHECGTTARRIG